jgi:hypothetical protein
MIPLVVGTVLAAGALAFVLYPIFVGARRPKPAPRVLDPATIDAEIEAAVRAYREKKHDRCAACGTPVVARDARYCSNCGTPLPS